MSAFLGGLADLSIASSGSSKGPQAIDDMHAPCGLDDSVWGCDVAERGRVYAEALVIFNGRFALVSKDGGVPKRTPPYELAGDLGFGVAGF